MECRVHTIACAGGSLGLAEARRAWLSNRSSQTHEPCQNTDSVLQAAHGLQQAHCTAHVGISMSQRLLIGEDVESSQRWVLRPA